MIGGDTLAGRETHSSQSCIHIQDHAGVAGAGTCYCGAKLRKRSLAHYSVAFSTTHDCV